MRAIDRIFAQQAKMENERAEFAVKVAQMNAAFERYAELVVELPPSVLRARGIECSETDEEYLERGHEGLRVLRDSVTEVNPKHHLAW